MAETLAGIEKDARRLTQAMERAHRVLHEEQRTMALPPDEERRASLVTIMGMGVLVNDVQQCRHQLEDISSRLPGLNGVPKRLQEQVCLLGRLLFALMEDTSEVELKAWRLAEERLLGVRRRKTQAHLPDAPSPLALREAR